MTDSVIVALGVLAFLTVVTVAAIVRYPIAGALKIVNALSGVLGVITGAFVAYFFTREPLAIARQEASNYKAQVEQRNALVNDLQQQVAGLKNATGQYAQSIEHSDKSSYVLWASKLRDTYGIDAVPMTPAIKFEDKKSPDWSNKWTEMVPPKKP